MNKRFANSVRTAAFSLTMSEKMVQALLMSEIEEARDGYCQIHATGTERALIARGLLRDATDEELQICMPPDVFESRTMMKGGSSWSMIRWACYKLTDAGNLLVKLLYEAGYDLTPDNRWLMELNPNCPKDDEPEFHLELKVKRKVDNPPDSDKAGPFDED